MCLLPDLHARQAVATSYTLSQHLLQHRLHSGVLVTLLLWSHFSRGHTFVFVWHWYGWLITRLGCMWMQNPSCTLAPPCVHTGCCEMNATMRERHCRHTTGKKAENNRHPAIVHTCSILCGSYAQIYCCIDMLHHISWFSKFVVSTNIPASQLPQPHAPSTKALQL